MIKKWNWKLYCLHDRHIAIDKIQDLLYSFDGYIIQHKMFSDLQMSLMIEIKEKKLVSFYDALKDRFKMNDLDRNGVNSNSEKNVLVFINVAFVSGKGKLENTIPDVPG